MSSVSFSATSCTDGHVGGAVGWNDPEWALNNDPTETTAASCNVGASGAQASDNLVAGGYPNNQLPGGATIVGITLGVACWATGSDVYDNGATLSIGSFNASFAATGGVLSTTPGATIGYGSSSSLPSGWSAITAANINSDSISSAWSCETKAPSSSGAYCSLMGAITVYYTAAMVTPNGAIVVRPGRTILRRSLTSAARAPLVPAVIAAVPRPLITTVRAAWVERD